MKIFLAAITLLSCAIALAAAHDEPGDSDWRKTAPAEKKVENLVKVMPGASNLMLQMGDRYRNLYWAGKKGMWEFAEYQIEEMQDLLETLIITRPRRAATAEKFLLGGFTAVLNASADKDPAAFNPAFQVMRKACMTCHVENDHAFIVLPATPAWAPSPVLETGKTNPAP